MSMREIERSKMPTTEAGTGGEGDLRENHDIGGEKCSQVKVVYIVRLKSNYGQLCNHSI